MLMRIGNMVRKEAIQFWRYKLLLIFVLIFPAVDMLGVQEAVSTQIVHIPTAVYDQDRSPSSRRLVSMLRGSRLFDPDVYVGSQAEMEQLMEQGTVKMGLVIPHNFGADMAGGRGTTSQGLVPSPRGGTVSEGVSVALSAGRRRSGSFGCAACPDGRGGASSSGVEKSPAAFSVAIRLSALRTAYFSLCLRMRVTVQSVSG